jgi:penicillin-binding protein 2
MRMKKNKNAMFKLKRDNDKIFSANNRGSMSQNNANSDEKKKDSSKIRVIVCVILLVVIFGGFALRLFDWQIVHGDEYKELSAASTAHTVQSDATRGEILDVNGTQLAVNETAYNIVINKVYASEDTDLNLIIINLLNTLNECGEDYIDELPISI